MSSPVQPPLRVETVDGTTSGRPITTIKVTNGDLSISGSTATIDTSGGGGGAGTVTSIVFSSPLTGGTITTTGTVGIPEADGTTDGYLSSTAYNTFDAKQDAITLTTTGSSGVATFAAGTLNIPNYTNSATIGGSIASSQVAYGSGANTIQGSANLTFDGTNLSVAGYVKSGTGVYDTNGATDLTLQTNSGTDTGKIVIFDGAGQDIEITPNGAGSINLDGLKWPNADGAANQVLKTDGAGTLSFTDASSGGSPGGSDTQLQYNSGGSFGGATAITYADTAGSEQLLIDDTSDQPLVKIVQQGTGPAFEVHDQATDTTIFAVTSTGEVLVGYASGTGTALKFLVSGAAGADSFRAASDGTAGAPAFTRTNEGDTGLFFPATNNTISISTAGSERFRFGASGELLIGGTDAGTSGQVLTSGGSGAVVSWATAGGSSSPNFPLPLDALDTTYKYLNIGTAAPYGMNTGAVAAREGDYTLNTRPRAFPFIAPASAIPVSLSVIQDTAGTGTATIGIYSANSHNYPETLVATGTYDPTSTGTRTATNTLSNALVGGELYFFCIRCDNNGGNIDAIKKEYLPSVFPAWRINEDDVNTCLDMNNITSGTALPTTADFSSGNSNDIDRPQMWLEF